MSFRAPSQYKDRLPQVWNGDSHVGVKTVARPSLYGLDDIFILRWPPGCNPVSLKHIQSSPIYLQWNPVTHSLCVFCKLKFALCFTFAFLCKIYHIVTMLILDRVITKLGCSSTAAELLVTTRHPQLVHGCLLWSVLWALKKNKWECFILDSNRLSTQLFQENNRIICLSRTNVFVAFFVVYRTGVATTWTRHGSNEIIMYNV